MTQARSVFEAVLGADTASGPRWTALLVLGLLLVHASTGILLARRAGARDSVRPTAGARVEWAELRRWSGITAAVFVVHYVVTLEGWGAGGQRLGYDALCASMASTWHGLPWVALVHLIGLGATVLYGLSSSIEGFRALGWLARPDRVRVAYGVSFALAALAFAVGLAGILALATGSWLPWVTR